MSLAGELTALGHPPERLDVTCRIVMDEVEGQGHQIVGSEVTVAATVPGVDEATFARAVVARRRGLPVLGSPEALRRDGRDLRRAPLTNRLCS